MTESAVEFFESWTLYDEIIDRNLMFHREIFAAVHSILASRFGDRPFSILDLGCGCARPVSSALEGLRVARYVGYDLSQAALDLARSNLRRLGGPVELRLGDLLEGLEDGGERFDVVFSSFAIHHLSVEEKARFFRTAADRLEDGGILMLIDAVRDEGEDRPTYLESYCGWIRRDWASLPEAALGSIFEHIRDCDFPEMPSTLEAMARDAGLVRSPDDRRFGRHRIFGFERASTPDHAA